MGGPNKSLECLKLLFGAVDLGDWPERPLADRLPAGHVRHGQYVLLDLWREAEHAHDLRHPGPGDALPAGDVGLVSGPAGCEEALPLDGLPEELNHTRQLAFRNSWST